MGQWTCFDKRQFQKQNDARKDKHPSRVHVERWSERERESEKEVFSLRGKKK